MRRCLLVLLLLLPVAAGAGSQLAGLEVMDVGGGARIVMEFDRPPKYRVLEFDSPPRLVMDFQDTRPAAGGPAIAARSALVRRVRHARRGDAGYRLVFDLAAPVGGAYSVRRPPRHPNRIVLSVRHPPGSGRKSAPSPAPARSSRAAPRGKPAPARDSQAAARKAVIVVDPGHGGKDPGATGVRATHDKDIALAVSKRLAGMINREYGMTARLTRANDRFLSLRERVEFARRHRADLFISIHADAAPNAKVHGASVYVLSEKGASTEAARLLARRDARIERDELRGVVHSVIGSKLGERAATRYAVWRDFQHSEKPMILLLGGAAGVGKTSLAQEVAHRLGITRVTSTDAIRQVMRIMLSRELAPTLHASSYEAHREHPLAAEAGEDRVVEAFRAQTATISVGVRAMMQRAIEEREDLILEGVSILPGLISPGDFAAEAHVIFLAVGALSEQSLARRFERRGGSGRRSSRRYLQNLGAILCIQRHILELAEQFELPIVDNQSFDDSVLSILRHVTESLRKHGGNAA